MPSLPRMSSWTMAGMASGSFSSQEWVAPSTTTSSPWARRAASAAGAEGDDDVAVAVDGEQRDAAGPDLARASAPLPPLRMIDTAGPTRRHGRRRCPSSVGATRLRSLAGLAAVAEQRHGGQGVEDQDAGDARQHRREQPGRPDEPVPRLADDGVDQQHGEDPLGVRRRSWVTSRPPIECPASTACWMPRASSTRPSRAL